MELTLENQDEVFFGKSLLLVLFSSSSGDECDHVCVEIDKEFQEAAQKFYSMPIDGQLQEGKMLRVDILESKEIAENFKVKKVPKVIFYRHGMYFDYTGSNDEQSYLEWFNLRL